jgi:hypothetical protein
MSNHERVGLVRGTPSHISCRLFLDMEGGPSPSISVWGFGALDMLGEVSLDGACVHQMEKSLDNSVGNSIFVFVKSQEEGKRILSGWRAVVASTKSGSRNRGLNLSLRFLVTLSSAHVLIEMGVESWNGCSGSGSAMRKKKSSKDAQDRKWLASL